MKVLIVTGTPGTGKTVIARKMAKQKDFLYVDVKKLIHNFKLDTEYDKKMKTFDVDISKLNKVLIGIIKTGKEMKVGGIVFDSHLAHYLPAKYVDECVVTRCDTKKLYDRLKKRGYSKKKIADNMEAEIMQVILEEARKMKHKINIVKT